MRPRRSSVRVRVRATAILRARVRATAVTVATALFILVAVPQARAQGTLSTEGALFLLVPVGARAVGVGQAVVASDIGSEAIWANPAGLAWLTRREVAINHSQTVVATGDALDIVVPVGKAGVLAATAYVLNYGSQEATDQFGATGTIYPHSYVFAASYAATFGSRVSGGVTYKFIQERVDCSGTCGNIPSFSASTNGIDLGVQVIADKDRRLTLGFDIRDAGLNLQINDAPQSDPLPTRLHLGAQYLVPGIEKSIPESELRVSAEVVAGAAFTSPAFRGGAELAYRKMFYLRAGFGSGSGDAAGAALGLGVKRGGISMDFARAFGGYSSDAGKPPTYLTLRFQF